MKCPHCDRDLPAGKRRIVGGRTHHAELEVSTCPTHGVVLLMREGLSGSGRASGSTSGFGFLPDNAADLDGGDVPVREPRPSPRTPLAGSAAVPEPKDDVN